jgi:putative transposase
MARKRFSVVQIIALPCSAKQRSAWPRGADDRPDLQGLRCDGAMLFRWRREYSGLKLDQAKRLRDLERENERLKKAVSELTLDKLILKEGMSEGLCK